MALTLCKQGRIIIYMKARHQFKSDEDYENYLVIYLASKLFATKDFQDNRNIKNALFVSIDRAEKLVMNLKECGFTSLPKPDINKMVR